MRIAHIAAPAQFGGLERVLTGLASAQVARGHAVMAVLVLSPGIPAPPWTNAMKAAGVTVEVLHVPGRGYWGERRLVRRILRDFAADVVHTHGYRPDVLHRGVARSLGLPIVSTAHGFASRKGHGLSLNERLQVWAWRRFDAVVAVSQPLREHLAVLGVPARRIHLIRNGIVTTGIARSRGDARAALRLPADGAVIGWVGRLSGEKDPLLAVEALACTGGAAHLCFVGDGPLRAACEERARSLGVAPRVHLVGARADAADLLRAFDALVLSSRTEGTPMVILEAAISRLPIVATAVGGVPDVVGEDALLVPAGDAAALGAAMQDALDDPESGRSRAARLASRLEAGERETDWVGAYEALYTTVVGNQRPVK